MNLEQHTKNNVGRISCRQFSTANRKWSCFTRDAMDIEATIEAEIDDAIFNGATTTKYYSSFGEYKVPAIVATYSKNNAMCDVSKYQVKIPFTTILRCNPK